MCLKQHMRHALRVGCINASYIIIILVEQQLELTHSTLTKLKLTLSLTDVGATDSVLVIDRPTSKMA